MFLDIGAPIADAVNRFVTGWSSSYGDSSS